MIFTRQGKGPKIKKAKVWSLTSRVYCRSQARANPLTRCKPRSTCYLYLGFTILKIFFLLKIHFERVNHNNITKKLSEKILSKKIIVKVKGGVSGVWSKTILSRFLIFGPFPKTCSLKKSNILRFCSFF